ANALLRLAEVENLRPSQLRDDINLVDTILDTVAYFGEKYPHQPIELQLTDEFTEQSSAIRVVGNATLLRTALINIVDNACKYSDFKPVTVRVQYEASWVVIDVLDEGIGIPDAQLTDVFLPMMRAGNVGTTPGFGLGLTLAKKIVDIHQGALGVDSSPGRGTTVSLRLPALPL
ncbi:MAG: HAMP domain-containing histidine kinase, partial [Bacteroidetes bacterium]|nr:HAMP domain-containing histidine kinase [Fibrella sp.]